jgi:hypothetical protein
MVERKRPSTRARGYGGDWAKLRASWQRRIDAGELIRCRRGVMCKLAEEVDGRLVGGIIGPATDWDLGHDDHDRTLPPAPEHRGPCNRATRGRGGSRKRPQEPHPGDINE